MSTNILALNSTKEKDQIVPNFKGWAPGAITLYYALISRASYDKENDVFYISKDTDGVAGRYWVNWSEIGESFGIKRDTLSRAKRALTGTDPKYTEFFPIVEESQHRITIHKIGDIGNFSQYIDNSVMRVLIAYTVKHGGDCFIMRVYSLLKIMTKEQLKFTITEMVAACGKYEQKASAKINYWNNELRNCLTFLMAFDLIELRDERVLHGKKPCTVFWATKFPSCNEENYQRICGFLETGILRPEEIEKARKILISI